MKQRKQWHRADEGASLRGYAEKENETKGVTSQKASTFGDVPLEVLRSGVGICVLLWCGWLWSTLIFSSFAPSPAARSNALDQNQQTWKSSATPEPIELFQSSNPVILKRHECIAKIRERQLAALRPFLERQTTYVRSGGVNRIMLVDPAYHGNVGDHMITLGEHELFRQLGWEISMDRIDEQVNHQYRTYRECHYVQAKELFPHCEEAIWEQESGQLPKQKVAVWHGGGNWGDLWRVVQNLRIQSFRPLVQNNFTTLISMPQSLFYQDPELERYDARVMQRELRVGAQLANSSINTTIIFTWREYESCTKAQELYPFAKNLLVPDIAFQLGPYEQSTTMEDKKQVDFLFLLRRDQESTLISLAKETDDDDEDGLLLDDATILTAITTAVKSAMDSVAATSSFQIVDWPDRLSLFHSNDQLFTKTSIQLLSMGRVVICDRLHAAILAFLMGVPFCYIDPTTGKISKSFRVAFDTWKSCDDDSNSYSLWYTKSTNLTDAILKGKELLKLVT